MARRKKRKDYKSIKLNYLSIIAEESLIQIADNLSPKDKMSLALTCKNIYDKLKPHFFIESLKNRYRHLLRFSHWFEQEFQHLPEAFDLFHKKSKFVFFKYTRHPTQMGRESIEIAIFSLVLLGILNIVMISILLTECENRSTDGCQKVSLFFLIFNVFMPFMIFIHNETIFDNIRKLNTFYKEADPIYNILFQSFLENHPLLNLDNFSPFDDEKDKCKFETYPERQPLNITACHTGRSILFFRKSFDEYKAYIQTEKDDLKKLVEKQSRFVSLIDKAFFGSRYLYHVYENWREQEQLSSLKRLTL